ncbi:hypothetical protein [Sinomicrobium sp. M5D2P9]
MELDFQQFIKKSEVVSQNTSGLNYLMKKNKIDVFHGLGSFVANECVQITDSKQNRMTIRYNGPSGNRSKQFVPVPMALAFLS